jgi:hypothetical protein
MSGRWGKCGLCGETDYHINICELCMKNILLQKVTSDEKSQ